MDVREIADGAGHIDLDSLRLLEPLHRQLRPQLPPDYVAYMKRVFADRAGMAALWVEQGPRALAVWRVDENTARGRRFYVDDLVTDEAARSAGAGAALLAWIEDRARAMGCDALELDSGTHRTRAHRFYFRQGFSIVSFAFSKSLKAAP